MEPKNLINDKTQYVWSNRFTPAKKILHNRQLQSLRHLEGLMLCTVFYLNASNGIVLYCTVQYCTALHCRTLYCDSLFTL